jgi:GTPase SAR1 family protein
MERSRHSRGERPNISTVGIVVSDWTYYKRVKQSQTALKSITFMTWDFGGQEEYYATHQCFLSRRSLYLVVWNVTHGMKGAQEIKPWLLNIQVGVMDREGRLSLSLSEFLLSHSLSLSPLFLSLPPVCISPWYHIHARIIIHRHELPILLL